jgi:hypothetical protein
VKKIIFLCLAVAVGYSACAQQKAKTDYMSITIYQSGNHISGMIVTRTDSAQEIRDLKIKVPLASIAKLYAAEDNALMTLLKPYYSNGWKLVSFAEIGENNLYKYYLSKAKQ